MLRRQFLRSSAALGAGLALSYAGVRPALAQRTGTERIILGGYAPAESSFGQGLTLIGERLEERFGDAVEVHYAYNVIDLGYDAGNALLWLVDADIVTLGYLSIDGTVRAVGSEKGRFCLACFDGKYPIPVPPNLSKLAFEEPPDVGEMGLVSRGQLTLIDVD